MRVCAVICEYNPFHLGHAYHLRAAREASGADYVLCLMSGALTQRGAFARHDKWLRARAALENGADVVLELPARFACSPAPDFAGGGVALLAALGVVTHLSFGCEPSALPLLSAAASLFKSESPDFSAALQRSLADGLPYPRARALAAEQLAGIPADLLAQPNAALALEYLQALPETIVPVPIARRGSGYHDASLSALSSATAVRAALARGGLTAARPPFLRPKLCEPPKKAALSTKKKHSRKRCSIACAPHRSPSLPRSTAWMKGWKTALSPPRRPVPPAKRFWTASKPGATPARAFPACAPMRC